MKCISALALVAFAAPSLTSGLKHVVLQNGESRLLSAASNSNIKQDAGPMTKATDSLPKVHNGGVNLFPYTADIRDYIVAAHNNARATMAPTEASNMRQVSWDESLAIEAAELVNTCVFSHDTENYAYGQNLMYGGRTITTGVVDSWMQAWVVDEISPSDRAGNGFMDLDHASAVLWANTYLVGCASKMCPNGYLTACNYFSPGNWQGEQAYVPGTPCSQCPTQAPFCDASGKLCTAQKPFAPTPAPAPAPTPAPAPAPAPAPGPGPAPAPGPGPAPAPGPGPAPVPAPTPALTTGSPLPKPTPAPTTGSPIQQNDGPATQSPPTDQQSGNAKPTPSPTWTSDNSGSMSPTEPITDAPITDSPIVQRPITSSPSGETPAPAVTDKWANLETSPATKPAMPGAIAALFGLVALARAL